MAYLVNITVLVDVCEKGEVHKCIDAMVRQAKDIIDWQCVSIDPVPAEIEDAIVNETYVEGDAFCDLVIFSRSESLNAQEPMFWSNELGWTTLDGATKFKSPIGHLPASAGDDAVWMPAPYCMHYYRVMLVDPGESEAMDFECWADDHEHARDQAENAYPGCKIQSVVSF